jgi:hypothetical protein
MLVPRNDFDCIERKIGQEERKPMEQLRGKSLYTIVYAVVIIIFLSPDRLSAQTYESLQALTDQKSDLLTESAFRSVMNGLRTGFEGLRNYMYNAGRRNPEAAIFLWDNYDNPAPYNVYQVVALHSKISDRWGGEIIHWRLPEYLRERDATYVGYLRDLEEPYRKLGAHARSLAGAYQNAAKKVAAPQAAPWRDRAIPDLTADLDKEDFFVVAEATRILLYRGEKDTVRAKLKSLNPKVRYRMAFAMWDLAIPSFFAGDLTDTMVALLTDEDPDARREAVGFFYAMRDTQQKTRIARLLADSSESVRGNALGYLTWAKAKKEVEALLKDKDEKVRVAAKEALAKME